MLTHQPLYRSFLSLLALAVVASGCRSGDAQEAKTPAPTDPVPVRTSPVIDTAVVRPIVAAGTVAPTDEVALSFKVGGVISHIAVETGDDVQAGQQLAALDLREIEAALAKARSAAEKAERDLARAHRLYADSVVTLTQLQDAETAAEQARADLVAASFNRQYAVIAAPAGGTILSRAAEPGETVAPASTILTLGSSVRGNVMRVGLADRDAVLVSKGDSATARFDAFPDRVFEGEITQIAGAADPSTGTYMVEVALRDGGVLAAGLVGHIEIRPDRRSPAALVPIEAILEADGVLATVYALSADGTHAVRRRVTVAFIDGDRVAVTQGLEEVAAVLTDGAAYVNDGSAVWVTQ